MKEFDRFVCEFWAQKKGKAKPVYTWFYNFGY